MTQRGSYYLIFFDNGGNDWGCSHSQGNCISPVIVPSQMARFINVVKTLDNIAIKEEIKSNFELISNYFDKDLLQNVIDDNYFITYKSANIQNQTALIFNSVKTKEIIVVCQMNEQ